MGRVAWLLVGLAACHKGGGSTDDGSTIVPRTHDDTAATTDSGEHGGGQYIDASYVLIVGRFGFDPDSQTAVPYARPGEALTPPSISVTLLDADAQLYGISDDNSCDVTLVAPGALPISGWAAAHGAWAGFDWPADSTVEDHCKNYGLPGSFRGDAGARVSAWTWGLGAGPLDDAVRATLASALPAAQWAALEPYVVGSAGLSPFFGALYGGDGYSVQGYTVANRVDGNFEIVLGGTGNPEPIPEDQVHVDPTLARAYYEVTVGPFLGQAIAEDPVSR